jgi:hypothetical protein
MLLAAAFCIYYVKAQPLVFNESFFTHAHCIVGGGMDLIMYAHEHNGRFPYHTNGYGDALLLVNAGWDAALTGPGYNADVFKRARATGENAPESEFGRVYVQGLTNTNDAKIALLFDKLPTPGGDHCQGLRRIWTPLAREVFMISGGKELIWEKDWPAFAKKQIELLVAAGISRQQAGRYYAEKPEKAVYKPSKRSP